MEIWWGVTRVPGLSALGFYIQFHAERLELHQRGVSFVFNISNWSPHPIRRAGVR